MWKCFGVMLCGYESSDDEEEEVPLLGKPVWEGAGPEAEPRTKGEPLPSKNIPTEPHELLSSREELLEDEATFSSLNRSPALAFSSSTAGASGAVPVKSRPHFASCPRSGRRGAKKEGSLLSSSVLARGSHRVGTIPLPVRCNSSSTSSLSSPFSEGPVGPLSPLAFAEKNSSFSQNEWLSDIGNSVAEVESDARNHRRAFQTCEELQAYLERYKALLPVDVSVKRVDKELSNSDGAEGIQLCLRGPVRPSPHAALLSIIEDALVEDCELTLPITSIHCSHFNFLMPNYFLDGSSHSLGNGKEPFEGNIEAMRYFMSPWGGAEICRCAAEDSEKHGRGTSSQEALTYSATCRFLIFLQNVFDSVGNIIQVREFQSITCDADLFASLSGLPFSSSNIPSCGIVPQLRILRWASSPLTAVHIDSLVKGLRTFQQCTGSDIFARLTELQLSGSLSSDSVDKLLVYFEECCELEKHEHSVLRMLRLPHSVLEEASRHTFTQAHPEMRVEPAFRFLHE